ncbi:MAG: PaREP1 family protein [Methanophagales archaeon]|nr:PaREP1 family protein [Methanophagales archaeon]
MSMGSAIGTEAEEKVDLKLNNKYLDEAEELIKKKDYVQAQPFKKALTEKASLKLWGAAAEMVKVVAAKRGIEIKSHRELYKFVAKLKTELGDPELLRLFSLAGALHQNFYENWLPPATVVDHAEAVKELVAKLKRAL